MSVPNSSRYFISVGASAGGVEALQVFFEHVVKDGRSSYIVIQHLSPDYDSIMASLISKVTDLAVTNAEDGMTIDPDTIYLIPPGKSMMVGEGRLIVSDQFPTREPRFPIDVFFRSLAEDMQNQSVGVILSGTGTDGSRGILSIKEVGGLVLVQSPDEAKFDGMPNSAIQSGCADVVCNVAELSKRLQGLLVNPVFSQDEESLISSEHQHAFEAICQLLQQQSEVDFLSYKTQTVKRRIARRMGIAQVTDIGSYYKLLVGNKAELSALSKDMLIGVTRFFRDDAFKVLEEDIFPRMMEQLDSNGSLRIWSAGCSTGEEAISLAILVDEYAQRTGKQLSVKIFATDVDPDAISIASMGRFPPNIISDLGEARFREYFYADGDGYTVIPRIRKMIIFAVHNLLADPPFSNSDLVVCRNVLIYFQRDAQSRVLDLLQFSLRKGGYLFLGSSETVKGLEETCRVVHERERIFQKLDVKASALSFSRSTTTIQNLKPKVPDIKSILKGYEAGNPASLRSITDAILEDYLPPSVLVNEDGGALHFYGDIGPYTNQQKRGAPSSHILDVLIDDLTVPTSQALSGAQSQTEEYVLENVPAPLLETALDLRVKRFRNIDQGMAYYLVMFVAKEERGNSPYVAEMYDPDVASLRRIKELEGQMRNIARSLQTSIEERETANEELQSSNEELLAANEELQSTNEELQSVNEELYTVNSEYQAKIGEVVSSKSDLDILINSLPVGIIFLNEDLSIRIFNPAATDYVNLIAGDVGRPLHQITHSLNYPTLISDVGDVLRTDQGLSKKVLFVNGGDVEVTLTSTSSAKVDGGIGSGCIVMMNRVIK